MEVGLLFFALAFVLALVYLPKFRRVMGMVGVALALIGGILFLIIRHLDAQQAAIWHAEAEKES